MLNDSTALDRAFQALSDPVRRGMLARLSRGSASVSELAAPHPISLPAVLQHLKALEASGLVHSRKVGRRPHRLARAEGALRRRKSWIVEQRSIWEVRLDRFEAHVAHIQQEKDK